MASEDGDIMRVECNGHYHFASRHLVGTNVSLYSFFALLDLIPFPLWSPCSGSMTTIKDNGRLQTIQLQIYWVKNGDQ